MQPNIQIHFFPYGSSALIRVVASSDSRLLNSIQLDTPHSIGLLWTSDQLDAETCTCPTHNTHNRQTSMLPASLEPAIPASECPQTDALDGAAAGIGVHVLLFVFISEG